MANKAKKIPHIKPINNFAMLFVLSIFQLITGFEAASVHEDFSTKAILSTLVLIALEWVIFTLLYLQYTEEILNLNLSHFSCQV